MVDAEPLILEELERLRDDGVPALDWPNVIARAEGSPPIGHRQRMLLVAALALTALAVVAVAVAATLGGFRSWLTGEPGTPASASAQSSFEHSTRSWRGFPRSTQLRRLVTADVRGIHYELDGFRGGGALCLRLVARGASADTRLACAPLDELRASKAPALVLTADASLGDTGETVTQGPLTFPRPTAAVTFGVIADAVRHIAISHRDPTPTSVFVSGDSFLAVSPGLSPFNATTKIVASSGSSSASVPFLRGGTPLSPPAPVVLPAPSGPTGVQQRVVGGAIRWFARRRPRGATAPTGVLRSVAGSRKVIFARMIVPDPGQPVRMVISISPAGTRYFSGRLRNNRQVCAQLVGPYETGDCWPAGRLFSTEPFTWGADVQRGGQVVAVAGLAADGVAALEAYPAIGAPRPISVHDNGYFLAAMLQDFPLRLVARDSSGQIIGNKILDGPLPTGTIRQATPAPGAKWTKVLVNSSGSVYTVRSTTGGLCIAFKLDSGASMGCDGRRSVRGISVGVGADRRHGWVEGLVGGDIRRLRLTLRNGQVVTVGPIHRYVLFRLEHSPLRDRRYGVEQIEGLSGGGTVIVTQRFG